MLPVPARCSKAEYVRCVALASSSLLYVATNQGLLYQVHLQWSSPHKPWAPSSSMEPASAQADPPEQLSCRWVLVDTTSGSAGGTLLPVPGVGADGARKASAPAQGPADKGPVAEPADKGPVVDLQLLPAGDWDWGWTWDWDRSSPPPPRELAGPCPCSTPAAPPRHSGGCHALALAWGMGQASALHVCACLPQTAHSGAAAKRPLWQRTWLAQGPRQLLNIFLCSALGPRSEDGALSARGVRPLVPARELEAPSRGPVLPKGLAH